MAVRTRPMITGKANGAGLLGREAWEAVEGSTRNFAHHDAVVACALLSRWHRRMWERMTVNIELDDVLKTLRAKRIPFVLTGAHGIAGWTGVPRGTQDVDILVKSGRNHARAVNALKAKFPQLEFRSFPGVTGFFPPGEKKSLIDVTYPHRADIESTLTTAIWTGEGKDRYRIPALECALANKYGAMLSPTRAPDKRAQDAIDFFRMVQHSREEGRQPIDLAELSRLGEMVWPGGGGKEIIILVEQAVAGVVPGTSGKRSSG